MMSFGLLAFSSCIFLYTYIFNVDCKPMFIFIFILFMFGCLDVIVCFICSSYIYKTKNIYIYVILIKIIVSVQSSH